MICGLSHIGKITAMKPIIVTGVVLLAYGAGHALAACPTTNLASRVDMRNLLSGNYACATRGAETWNELHQGTGFSGNLQDYKKGPTDPVDKSAVVGSYTLNNGTAGNPDTITYTYPPSGGSYTYVVTPAAQTPGTYTFCNVSTSELITVKVRASPTPIPPPC